MDTPHGANGATHTHVAVPSFRRFAGEPPPGGTPPAPGGEQPEYVTKDDLAAAISGAMTNHSARLEKKINDGLAKQLEGALAPFKTLLEKPPPGEPPPGGAPAPKGDDPELVKVRQQLNEMQANFAKEQTAREAAETKARDQQIRGALRAELTGKVRPEAIEDLTDLLIMRKRIAQDEEGKITFTHRCSITKGAPEDDHVFPLTDGVKEFLKSRSAEVYLPAPGNTPPLNKGGRPPGPTVPGAPQYSGPAKTDDEKIRRANEITASLRAKGLDVET